MTAEFVAHDERPAVTYGPSPKPGDEWVLSVSCESERVEVLLDEDAMYQLWTEVKGVPWPGRAWEIAEKDRLVRQVVHAANGADPESLRDALDALGGPA